MTAIIQKPDEYICFAVFDQTTKSLIYSKYNFDFTKYRLAYPEFASSSDNKTFYDFLVRNNSYLDQPFTVLPSLTQYFTPMNDNIKSYFDLYNYILWYFNFNTLPTFANSQTIMDKEFLLYGYSFYSEIPSLCEFLHETSRGIFCKYNFKFDLYSSEFNVYGSKICIFYDFYFRATYLSGNEMGFVGYYNFPTSFDKYFDLTQEGQSTLNTYLLNYSIFSSFENVSRSVPNINYTNYRTLIKNNYGLTITSDTQAKLYFLKTGQFQQDAVQVLAEKNNDIYNLKKSVCTIISTNSIGTGFLINGPPGYDVINGKKQIYLVTCYHIIQNGDKETFFVSCSYINNTHIRLQFRVIAYDIPTDICVALYDENLDYNKTFFPDDVYKISQNLQLLTLSPNTPLSISDEIFTIGNPGLIDNSAYINGKIMDPQYSGDFNQQFLLANPPTILSNMFISKGNSGSPIFTKNVSNQIICVGMINATIGNDNQYAIGINSKLFYRIIGNGVIYWYLLLKKYSINDIENITYYIKEIYPKKWLGAICSFYHPYKTKKLYKEFTNFYGDSGIVLSSFILGFHTIKKEFVYDYQLLTEQGVIKINTFLLKSQMYVRYNNNGKVPILLKSIKVYDRVNGVYNIFEFGKHNYQYSLDILTYNILQMGTIPNDPKYTNPHLRYYAPITFVYYYYNGRDWNEVSEVIGGNDSSLFNTYNDSYGHLFYQHNLELPFILTPYLNPFGFEDILAQENRDLTRGSENLTRGSENLTRGSENLTRGSENLTRGSENLTRG